MLQSHLADTDNCVIDTIISSNCEVFDIIDYYSHSGIGGDCKAFSGSLFQLLSEGYCAFASLARRASCSGSG